VRIVNAYELDSGLFQPQEEMSIPGKSVQLRDDQLRPVEVAGIKGRLKLGTVVSSLCALDFRKLFDQLPIATIEIRRDRRALCIKAQAAPALLVSADPVVSNPFARGGHRQAPFYVLVYALPSL
jgi:hypothetical protein